MPPFGGEWGTKCPKIRFPLPTLLHTGYRVKLIKIIEILVMSSIPSRGDMKCFHFVALVTVSQISGRECEEKCLLYAGYSVKHNSYPFSQ